MCSTGNAVFFYHCVSKARVRSFASTQATVKCFDTAAAQCIIMMKGNSGKHNHFSTAQNEKRNYITECHGAQNRRSEMMFQPWPPPLPFTPKHQSTLLVIQGLQWVLGALWVLKHLVALVGIIIGDNFKKTWKEEPQIPKACTSFHVLLSLSMSESPSSNTGLLDTHILTEYIPVPWGTCQSSGRKKWWKEAGRMSVTSTFPFLKMQLWRKLKLDAWNSYIEWDTASAGPETIQVEGSPRAAALGPSGLSESSWWTWRRWSLARHRRGWVGQSKALSWSSLTALAII